MLDEAAWLFFSPSAFFGPKAKPGEQHLAPQGLELREGLSRRETSAEGSQKSSARRSEGKEEKDIKRLKSINKFSKRLQSSNFNLINQFVSLYRSLLLGRSQASSRGFCRTMGPDAAATLDFQTLAKPCVRTLICIDLQVAAFMRVAALHVGRPWKCSTEQLLLHLWAWEQLVG